MKIETNNIVNNRSLHLAVSVGMVEFHTSHDFGGEGQPLFANRIENRSSDALFISDAMGEVLDGITASEHKLDLLHQLYRNAEYCPEHFTTRDSVEGVETLVSTAIQGLKLLRSMSLHYSGSIYRCYYGDEFGSFVDGVIADTPVSLIAYQLRNSFDPRVNPSETFSKLAEFYSAASESVLAIESEPMYQLLNNSGAEGASVAWKLIREVLNPEALLNPKFIADYMIGSDGSDVCRQGAEKPTRFEFGALLLLAPIIGWHENVRASSLENESGSFDDSCILKPIPWVDGWFRSGEPCVLAHQFTYHTEGLDLL